MYNTAKDFEQLKQLLEGRTIAKIKPPNAPEAICCFVLTDGSAFRLHATELGYWIEKTAGVNGYSCLDDLLVDYDHYCYISQLDSMTDAVIDVKDKLLKIIAPDGKVFEIRKSCLSEKEKQIIDHPVGCAILANYAVLGDCWKLGFHKNKDCPEELKIELKEMPNDKDSNNI